MNPRVDDELATLDQIEDLLRAYADARLTPAGPVLARMRAQALREAAARSTIGTVDRAEPEAARATAWGIRGLHLPRRAVAFGLAATLTLGTGAAVLAAPPGSPLYDARVAIEVAFLPTQADARLAAHEDHLNQRLMEATAAARRGDLIALAAALAAYRAEVDAAVADVGDDSARLAHLEEELARHTSMLQALAAQLPEQSSIEHAIDTSQQATTKLKDKGSHPAGRPTDTPAGQDSQQTR